MAQVTLLKIDTDGINVEFDSATDEITLASFTVQGGGPVLNANLDMNNGNISDAGNLAFTDPTTDGITNTSGLHPADKIMFTDEENSMDAGAAVLFPVVADTADELDAFRLPSIAGTPSAAPADGGEGYIVWDSTNDKQYAWDGSSWKDLSVVNEAGLICNSYIADEILLSNDAVYISAADNVSKADASGGGAGSRVIGFTSAAAADTAAVAVCSEGLLSGFTGLVAGDRYFADPSTPGAITNTIPNGAGNTIVQVGYAKSATELQIHIEQLGRRS